METLFCACFFNILHQRRGHRNEN